MVAQEIVGNAARAHAAVAFAEDVLRRCPAAVLRQVLDDEFRDGLDVLVDTPEVLALGVAHCLGEAGAYRVDHDEIGLVDDAVLVIDAAIRSVVAETCIGHDGTLRAEDAHMQPDRRGTRAAVVREHDRALAFVRSFRDIGRIADQRLRLVLVVLHQHRAGSNGVSDFLTADASFMLGDVLLRLWRFALLLGLFVVVVSGRERDRDERQHHDQG